MRQAPPTPRPFKPRGRGRRALRGVPGVTRGCGPRSPRAGVGRPWCHQHGDTPGKSAVPWQGAHRESSQVKKSPKLTKKKRFITKDGASQLQLEGWKPAGGSPLSCDSRPWLCRAESAGTLRAETSQQERNIPVSPTFPMKLRGCAAWTPARTAGPSPTSPGLLMGPATGWASLNKQRESRERTLSAGVPSCSHFTRPPKQDLCCSS